MRIKLIAGLTTLLAVTAATTAVALPGGKANGNRVEKRQDAQAKALGQKLGIDQARVKKALQEIRGDRRAKAQDRRAAAVGKALGVSSDTAKRALAKGRAARKATEGTRKAKGKAFRAAVAKETGKTEAQVKSAMKSVRKAAHQRRMKAGAVR